MNEEQNMNQQSGGQEGSAGPVIGTIIILAVIVLGGLYFWGQRSDDGMMDDTAPTEEMTEGEVESANTQSDSDDVDSIDADLDATDVDDLDAEVNAS